MTESESETTGEGKSAVAKKKKAYVCYIMGFCLHFVHMRNGFIAM